MAASVLGTCTYDYSLADPGDATPPCQGDQDCPDGYHCVAPNCVRNGNDGGLDGGLDAADAADAAQPLPDITVAPSLLDFGAAPLHESVTLPFTITNSGDAELLVTAITVEETGSLKEVAASIEGPQNPALRLLPGGQTTVQVTLTPEDGEVDSGQLRIASNDPDEPETLVAFVSRQEGVPILDVCVLDDATDTPEPFVDCAVDPGTGDPLVDFGVVHFTETATQLLTARNLSGGNAPLVITDVYVTVNAPPSDVYYGVELFRLEPGTGGNPQEVTVSLPTVLRAADVSLPLEEDHLYVRLTFLGKEEGAFPARSLVFETNDATTPQTEVPIIGILSGCPPDQWDIDGNPNNGCEYRCVYGGPETCDGADNDCDGLVDEENAGGCALYYRDSDNDSYGVSGDSRCLCGSEGLYRAERGGDCDDTRSIVNPGMLENCQTAFDDDCDGSSNNLGALNCTTYFRDQDLDGFGVTGSTECRCAPTGLFTATLGGDCNDTDPNVRPGVQEDCGTAYDDNCNGNTNEDDALNCLNYYVDLDNDGYGQTMLSRCLCAPTGNYRATLPNDCNDNATSVNPGVQENCSTGVDDNCNNETNEPGALNCIHFYLDVDGDGYGVTTDFQCLCAPLGNYRAMLSGDCNDGNSAIKPGAQELCSTPADDNCNGDTNDLGALGCTVYFRDADQDGYGLISDTECRCQPQGEYTATTVGDCNDGAPGVNPGAQETCATPYDDDCDGDTSDLGAQGCVNYYWDLDNDGYGIAGASECRCAPAGNYRALFFGDCADGNDAIYPGVTEICDYVDNNCANGIDEGFNLLSDPANCGSCGHLCTNEHGAVACISGDCVPSCDEGWGSCDDNPDNGCETDLSLVGTCGSCSVDLNCPEGFFCDLGTCALLLVNGDPCIRGAMCESDHCVDGRCCDTLCEGTCEACNIPSFEGTCTPHAVGTDPQSECTATAQSTCQENGHCDGARGCALWPLGTICLPQSCAASVLQVADTCDGSGLCEDRGTQSCNPYQCNGSGTACLSACGGQGDCISGYYCSGGSCVPKLVLGAACSIGDACISGNCADGVCCDTACTGTCRACDLAATVGTCTNRPASTDPQNECGLCRVCNGLGACALVPAGQDPESECAQQAEASCGTDGECDGSGGCRLWASGTQCVAQSCTGATKNIVDRCNGGGQCVDGGWVDCSPYLCDAVGFDCRTSCTSNADCVATSFCNLGTFECDGKKAIGQACVDASQCVSNSCVDGVCCNGDCSGTCRHCNLAGSVGTCVNIPSNQDPDAECTGVCRSCTGGGACGPTVAGVDPENECTAAAPESCGTDGQCDGASACRFWSATTVCLAQTCTNYTRYLADTCSGAGSCVDNGSASCSPYVCDSYGLDCRHDCTNDEHCVKDFYCNLGACVAKRVIGQACTLGNECVSGFCSDGVCCNADCSGACRACNLAGSVGTCVNHAASTDPELGCGLCRVCDGLGACAAATDGTDPKEECALQAPSSCGLDGDCNGVGACGKYPSGTICIPQSCTGSTQYNVDSCDGLGACLDGGQVSCAPYVCSGSSCLTSCTQDSHCVSGNYCAGGVCVGQKALGLACVSGNECLSNSCADGVCCNSDCAGLCRACDIAGSVGNCSPYALDTDPDNECGLCQVCNGGGACALAADGTDPKGQCTADDPSTCEEDGQCNGMGSCRLWAAGTQCLAASCTGSTYYPADQCNGAGTCTDGGTVSCAPYACSGGVCGSGCTLHTQCAAGYYCSASNTCVSKKADGQTCGGTAECQSGFCQDGVCCGGDCTGACRACNLAGSLGVCTYYNTGTDPQSECGLCKTCDGAGSCVNSPNGTDPKNECVQDSQASCDQDGQCNGTGACRLWPIGTVCAAQSCSVHVKYLVDSCDGGGTCQDGGTVDCSPYECSGSECRLTCTDQAHCIAGYYCSASNTCLAKKPIGQICGVGTECQTGFCVDGYCCDGGCTGACRSCNLTGFLGTCTLHPTGTDPEDNCGICRVCDATGACVNAAAGTDPAAECTSQAQSTCGLDGECSGTGACRLWSNGTECQASTCTGSTLYPADLCNGSGTCLDGGSSSCSPYTCNDTGTACRISCTLSSQCVAGYHCTAGSCVPDAPAGTPCTLPGECAGGNCVDGFCCNNECVGPCRSCGLVGSEGTCTYYGSGSDPENNCGLCRICDGFGACTNASNGTDPKSNCPTDAQSTCDRDGSCDGLGACRLYASGTVCEAQSCTGSTRYLADTCDGLGTCSDNGTSSCTPYLCSGTSCATSCTLDTDCLTGYYCAGTLCQAKKTTGLACGGGNECQTGNCVDGVCCATTCTGACRACNLAGSLGTCTNYGLGVDPEVECGLCRVCNGSGACMAAADGTDPKNECTPQSQGSCGLDGDCNGAGACGLWPSGTVCTAQSCTSSTLYNTDYCDGLGVCQDSGTQPCSPYQCSGSSCATTCSGDADCVTGYYCSGTTCTLKKTNGTTCSGGNQCQTGYCVDGVCCNGECTGACRACNRAGFVGTCSYYALGTDPELNCPLCYTCDGAGACAAAALGTDPKNECAQDPASTCDRTGDCNGAGACQPYYSSGTLCQAKYCSGSVLYNDDLCDGGGTCSDGGTVDCSPYLCSGTACLAGCTLDSHCVSGYYCGAGVCLPKKPNGNTCSTFNECTSNNCVDGYCCNTSCVGACRACNVAGSEGLCTTHLSNTDPENDCTACNVCNGLGSCTPAASGTDPVSDCTLCYTCNGAGSCAAAPAGTDPKVECEFCYACNGLGACTAATAGTDPKSQCASDPQSSCDQTGWCNGSGTCQIYPVGTQCQAQSCTSGVQYYEDLCDGLGNCSDGGSIPCSPYVCDGVACRTSCTEDNHCATGYTCVGGICQASGGGCGTCGTPCTGSTSVSAPGGRYTINLGVHDKTGSCGGSGSEAYLHFTLASPADVFITTHNTIGEDTVLYLRSCCCTGDEVTGGCNDDADGLGTSKLQFTNLPAGSYFVFVDMKVAVSQAVDVDINITTPGLESDRCGRPRRIPPGTTSISDNSCNYTADYSPVGGLAWQDCPWLGGGLATDQVYYFVLPASADVTISGCSATNYDSTIYLRSVCGDSQGANQVDCADDTCGGVPGGRCNTTLRSTVTTTLSPGLYYYFQDGYDPSIVTCPCGSYTFMVSGI